MRIYLDNCAFNRPFDDQRQIRVRLEAEAKLYVQDKIKNGEIDLIWSYILEFENEANPFAERKVAIKKWRSSAAVYIAESPALLATAKEIINKRIKTKDALHVASAIEAKESFFVTTDDRLIKRLADLSEIKVVNPVDMIGQIDEYDE